MNSTKYLGQVHELLESPRYMKHVRFSHIRVFFDSRNVQKHSTKSDTLGHCLVHSISSCLCRVLNDSNQNPAVLLWLRTEPIYCNLIWFLFCWPILSSSLSCKIYSTRSIGFGKQFWQFCITVSRFIFLSSLKPSFLWQSKIWIESFVQYNYLWHSGSMPIFKFIQNSAPFVSSTYITFRSARVSLGKTCSQHPWSSRWPAFFGRTSESLSRPGPHSSRCTKNHYHHRPSPTPNLMKIYQLFLWWSLRSLLFIMSLSWRQVGL